MLYLNFYGRNNFKFCIIDRIIILIFFFVKKLESMGNNGIIFFLNVLVENVYIGVLVLNLIGIFGDFFIVMLSFLNNIYWFKIMFIVRKFLFLEIFIFYFL